MPDTELTPTVLPEDDSDEDDDDFSYQLAEEDHHLLEELRRRQMKAQEEIIKLIDADYSTFLSDSYKVLQESFDLTTETNADYRVNSGLSRSTEVSNIADINTTRFTQTDLTLPPEEEDLFNLFNTTMNESFDGFCPLDYSIDQDSFEELVPKALSPIMEEPDSYYQLNFSDEFSDKTADSLEGFDPEGFFIEEEDYMEIKEPVKTSSMDEERQMNITCLMGMDSREPEPSPRRLRSQGEAPQHSHIMDHPLEYRQRSHQS